MVRIAGCMLLSVALFVPLGAWLFRHVAISPAEVLALAQQFVLPACWPEPG